MEKLAFDDGEEYTQPPGLVDVHCHILPGVDDGASDLRMAMTLLNKEYNDGIRAIILTPHFRLHMFENNEDSIYDAYDQLCEEAEKHFGDLELYLGCELHSHMDMIEAIRERDQFRLVGSDFVLVEFSSADSQKYIRDCLYKLRSDGFDPIVAHVERYKTVREDLDFAESLTEMGARLQVNADSIIGRDGFRIKRFCRELMERDLLFCVGSDAHDPKSRPPRMKECASLISKKMGLSYMQTVMRDNPREIIIAGEKYGNE